MLCHMLYILCFVCFICVQHSSAKLLLFKGSSKRGPPSCCPAQNSVTTGQGLCMC